MKYEWDKNKERTNFEKHGFSFADADLVFSDKTITFPDKRQDYNEERFVTIGKLKGRMVVVIHTYRNDKIRLISMRKADEREQKNYQERLKED